MTYTITREHAREGVGPFTSDDDPLGYGSVVDPEPQVRTRRVARPRATWAQRLRLSDPGFDEVREERWHWHTAVDHRRLGTLASWHGWAPSFEEAWDACSRVKRVWVEANDRRPFTVRWLEASR